jgi:hypothetical protein
MADAVLLSTRYTMVRYETTSHLKNKLFFSGRAQDAPEHALKKGFLRQLEGELLCPNTTRLS